MSSADKFKPKQLKGQLQREARKRRSRRASEVAGQAVHTSSRNDLQPAMATVMVPIHQLKAAPHRTRISTPEVLLSLIKSVSQFGILLPLLIDGENQIIAGHQVWEVGKAVGLKEMECRIADHLSPLECEAASLALNRLGELGSYDLDTLRSRMIELKSGGIELTSTGFTLPELDQILASPTLAGAAVDVPSHDEPCDVISQPGDIFQLGDHRLLCGDALDFDSYKLVLAGGVAACVFSDPPYNCAIEGFTGGLGKHKHTDFVMGCGMATDAFGEFLTSYLAHCKASSSKGAVIFACMDWRELDTLLIAGRNAGLERNNVVCWNKGSGGMGGLYRNAHEFVAVFINGAKPKVNNVQLGVHGRDRTNVWTYPGANRIGSSAAKALVDHPTPKPVELVQDALLDVTRPGDVVLDPFSGSGSTIIAAELSGRLGRGIELDPKYVDRSIRRWEALTGKQAVHVSSGKTLAELAVERLEGKTVED